MTNLYVCRHGESLLNLQQKYAGQLDTPLTQTGRKQAASAGLQALELSVNLIIASPLQRALETAQIIAQGSNYSGDIITNSLLVERSYGSLQGLPWTTPPDPKVFPGIETEAALETRARQAYNYLQSLPQETLLVVSHGSFLLALATLISGTAQKQELPNAQIVQLV